MDDKTSPPTQSPHARELMAHDGRLLSERTYEMFSPKDNSCLEDETPPAYTVDEYDVESCSSLKSRKVRYKMS